MFYSTTTAEAKRENLRSRLGREEPLVLFGAFNALTALMIQRNGGEGVYLSGHMIAADLGLPDLGLTTVTEVAMRSQQVSRMIDIPLMVDADTGFGEPLNMARSIQTLEDAGVAACHVEDQVNPKQCGHSEGIKVVERDAAVQRVAAAVAARRDPNFVIIARTDARAAIGLDEAIRRGKSYRDAGADVIFAEALRGEKEYERFMREVDAPLMVNLNEFGSGTPLSREELRNIGVSVAVYPMTLMRLALGAVERGIQIVMDKGSQAPLVSQMQTKDELYSYLGYSDYQIFDNAVFSSSEASGSDAGLSDSPRQDD